MEDTDRTRDQLIEEIAALRRQVAEQRATKIDPEKLKRQETRREDLERRNEGLQLELAARRRTDEERTERERRAQLQQTATVELLDNEFLASGNTAEAFRMLTRIASKGLAVERVSVWLLAEDGEELLCEDLFEASRDEHIRDLVLLAADYPSYFAAIHGVSRVSAEDARTDPRTREFTDGYLVPLGITSMMDSGIFVAGKLAGIICFEHTGEKRRWQTDEESFAGMISAIAAQALTTSDREQAEDALRESEARLHAIIESLPFDLWGTDARSRYILQNSVSRERWGNNIGKRPEDLGADGESLSLWQENTRRVLEGEIVNGEVEYVIEGELGIYAYTIAPIWGGTDVIGTVGINLDITERKQAEQRVLAEQKSREAFSRIREQLWSMVDETDLDDLMEAMGESLRAMDVPYRYFGVNIITPEGDVLAYSMDWKGKWSSKKRPVGKEIVLDIFDKGKVAYRRNLEEEDVYHELAGSGLLRSIVDVPFSHGTVAVSSKKPDAFSTYDLQILSDIAKVLSETFVRLDDMRKLKDSEERFRSLFQAMNEGVCLHEAIYDPSGKIVDFRILDINPQFGRILGLSRAAILGKLASEVYGPGDPPYQDIYVEVAETGKSSQFETRLSIVDKYFSVSAFSPERNKLATVFEDITERRRMEEDIRRAHNLESLGLLAGGIAHDFNNILTGITGNLSLLMGSLDPGSEEREITAEAQQAAAKTKMLTQQLMTFAKGGEPVKKSASIEALIKETTELTLRGSKIRPLFDLPESLPSVEIDIGQISQVIQNLVLNADQAMPAGGVLKLSAEKVDVSEKDPLPLKAGLYVKVSIEDQGIGIPADLLAQVFDPYFSTKPQGHGLGLSIVHSVIQRHKGHITVHSTRGAGTTFEFYLPVSQTQAAPAVEKKREIATGTGRILLMDDEEIIQRTMGRMLGKFGYEVVSVYDGNEALSAYRTALDRGTPFDIVIMDLTIPGTMGGKEAVGQLLKIDPEARVLVSSGYSNDPVMANYAAYGFCGRLAKPVGMQELAETVKRVLTEKEGAEEVSI
jgi:PAS domain S-box-containing protein